jgi:transcriptional regulator with XRE-family HTH domain
MNYETLLFHEAIRLLIISVRQKQQHTQQSLSIESGISRQFISQLECGKRIPSIDTLCQLAIALKTSISCLSVELDRIYQQLFWQRHAQRNETSTVCSAENAAENRNFGLEYIRKTGGLDRL